MGKRKDPVGVYQYNVQISGLTEGIGFTEVSGFDSEMETEQIYEGGVNDRVYYLPKRMKYGKLVLKKGICLSTFIIDWFNECKKGKINKKDITVELMDSTKSVVYEWGFINAYPVKCSGPRLVAQNSNEVAIEAIEFVFEELLINNGG